MIVVEGRGGLVGATSGLCRVTSGGVVCRDGMEKKVYPTDDDN
jgi:hypothetical protein